MKLVELEVESYDTPDYDDSDENIVLMINPEYIVSAEVYRDELYLDMVNGYHLYITSMVSLERAARESEIMNQLYYACRTTTRVWEDEDDEDDEDEYEDEYEDVEEDDDILNNMFM